MSDASGLGSIVAVRGVVVDVRFDHPPLPALFCVLDVLWDRPESLTLEVEAGARRAHGADGVLLRRIAQLEATLGASAKTSAAFARR
jgi:F0F1-type ATP synthase beta subunit